MRVLYVTVVLPALLAMSHEAAAQPDRFQSRSISCPVCEQKISLGGPIGCIHYSGKDSDLHWRSSSDSHRLQVNCQRCGYVRSTRGFKSVPSPEVRERIRTELAKAGQDWRRAEGYRFSTFRRWIPVRARYQRALRILEWENATAAELANHYCQAGWAMRTESRRLLKHMRLSGETRQVYEEASQRPEGDFFSPEKDPLLRWAESILAVLRTGVPLAGTSELAVATGYFAGIGESGKARACLDHFALTTLPVSEEIRKIMNELSSLVAEEVRLLELHRAFAEKSLTGEQDPSFADAERALVAGETSRKLGERDQALRWYSIALSNPDNPPQFLDHVAELYERLAGEPYSEAKFRVARRRSLARVFEILEDPERSHRVFDELDDQRGPFVVEGLSRALRSPHGPIRSRAAGLLRSHHECTDALVAELEQMVLDDPPVARQAAHGVAEFGRAASLPMVEEVLTLSRFTDSSDGISRSVCEAMVTFLGFVGDETHLDLIWSVRHHALSEARTALQRLANCPTPRFETREEIREWFAAHRPGTREEWALAGFREAGIELPDPTDPARASALVGLLRHEDAWIRCNAVRLLRLESNQNFPWEPIASDMDWWVMNERRHQAIELWDDWLRDQTAVESGAGAKSAPSERDE